LSDQTSLIGGGEIDSLNTLKLIDFLEKEFNVDFEAHEANEDYLDNLLLIEKTIKSKLS